MNETYRTIDLTLAAVLCLYEFELLELVSDGTPHKKFVFNKSEELMETVKEYRDDRITVEPKLFMSKLRDLKTEIFSG